MPSDKPTPTGDCQCSWGLGFCTHCKGVITKQDAVRAAAEKAVEDAEVVGGKERVKEGSHFYRVDGPALDALGAALEGEKNS